MAIEHAANELDELLDRFVDDLKGVDVFEDNSTEWDNLDRLIKARSALDHINLENWKMDLEAEQKESAAKRAVHDKRVDTGLRALDILVKAGSIAVPAGVMIYFTALNLKADDDGILIRNDPAMKYMEKMIGNIGKVMK